MWGGRDRLSARTVPGMGMAAKSQSIGIGGHRKQRYSVRRGGALTREKIVAAVSNQFICIADESKLVDVMGKFPLPIEVIPMATNYVKREIIKSIGGNPILREELTTDNGNLILDIHDLTIDDPKTLENRLNNIVGVVTNGLFAKYMFV